MSNRYTLRQIVLSLGVVLTCAHAGTAQEVIDLDAFGACQCELVRAPVAELGWTEGEGMVASDNFRVATDATASEFAVVWGSDPYVHIYDASGQFLRVIGRPGEGPGEIRSVFSFMYQGNRMVIHDGGNQRWLSFSKDGILLSEVPSPIRIAGGLPIRGDSVILAGEVQTPDNVGYPFHVVDPATGVLARSLGSETGRSTATTRRDLRLELIGVSNEGTVFAGRRDRLEIQEWSFSNQHLRTWVGSPSWFPPSMGPFDESGRPTTRLTESTIGGDGRLWLKLRVAGDEWEAVMARNDLTSEVRPQDLRGLYQLELHVLDLKSREYLGSITELPSDYVRVVLGGPYPMFASIETHGGIPPLQIYRFEVRRSDPS